MTAPFQKLIATLEEFFISFSVVLATAKVHTVCSLTVNDGQPTSKETVLMIFVVSWKEKMNQKVILAFQKVNFSLIIAAVVPMNIVMKSFLRL